MSNSNALLVALRQINRAIDLQSKKLEKETGQTTPQLLLLKELAKDGRAKPSVIATQPSASSRRSESTVATQRALATTRSATGGGVAVAVMHHLRRRRRL